MMHLEELDQAAGLGQTERSVVIRPCVAPWHHPRRGQVLEGAGHNHSPQPLSPEIGLGVNPRNLPDLFVVREDKTGTRQLAFSFDPEPLRTVLELPVGSAAPSRRRPAAGRSACCRGGSSAS